MIDGGAAPQFCIFPTGTSPKAIVFKKICGLSATSSGSAPDFVEIET
jgi:hypothetical protein